MISRWTKKYTRRQTAKIKKVLALAKLMAAHYEDHKKQDWLHGLSRVAQDSAMIPGATLFGPMCARDMTSFECTTVIESHGMDAFARRAMQAVVR